MLFDPHPNHTAYQRGPWNRASSLRIKDEQTLDVILSWCEQEFQSKEWAFQYRNNFANKEVIFYFNDLRDYTIFVLKYQR